MRIEFELRKKQDGTVISLDEKYPINSYDANDSLPRNAIIATARVCRRCPLMEKCSPSITTVPKGLLRRLAIVVKGAQISSKECRIRRFGVNSTFNLSKNRNPILNAITSIEITSQGDKIFHPKR